MKVLVRVLVLVTAFSLGFVMDAVGGQGLVPEVDPNDTTATATPLGGADVVAIGNIVPASDVDYWSFQAAAGDRVYAATMTFFASFGTATTDTVLDVVASDGVTVLEADDNDGVFSAQSSSIAGCTIPTAGTYWIRVRPASPQQIRPYHLHFRLRSGSPASEVEPTNNTYPGQALPAGGWVAGTVTSFSDNDYYSLNLNAGDTVFASLDEDPDRDGTEMNMRVGIGRVGDPPGAMIQFDDGNDAGPDSDVGYLTVRTAGTYAVQVSTTTGASNGTYHLSVSVHPAVPATANCTTYTSSTSVPIADLGLTSSTITVPGHPRIADLDVSLRMTHANFADLDVHLRSPEGNDNGLFSDIGASSQIQMDTIIDDEAALPTASIYWSNLVSQPKWDYRLSWFDGEDAGGVWTLDIRDDTSGAAGTLTGWSLTICEPAPTACAGTPVVVYGSDFEADGGGFTHGGTNDQWQRGLPTAVPITTCHSGAACWKTNLNGNYAGTSIQDLNSPVLDLTSMAGPISVSWSQRYQLEANNFDHAFVEIAEVPTANPRRLWEYTGPSMTDGVGNPVTTIQESAGWGLVTADISAYAGKSVALRFHVDSSGAEVAAGLAVDDVAVTWCCTAAACDDADACTIDACGAQGCIHVPAAPVEAADLDVASDKQTLTWTAVPGGVSYDVVRGSLAALPVGPGGDDETCFNDLPSPTVADGEVPAAGAGFWYLARGKSTCGTGTWGTTSAGGPRLTASCP